MLSLILFAAEELSPALDRGILTLAWRIAGRTVSQEVRKLKFRVIRAEEVRMASEEVSGSDSPLLPPKDVEKAERRERLVYVALLLLSLFNVLEFVSRQKGALVPQWPMKAVRDAELAAMEWCSGHGHVFVDTMEVTADGKPVCECHECFTGPDCSISTADCVADVDVGDPLLFEEYWKSNPDLGTVVIPGWYRMSYFTNDAQRIFFTDALTASIRELHALTGNAVTEGRYIAVGNGAMQLINAIVHGLALQDTNAISHVVATAPYYNLYHTQTNFLDSQHYEWAGEPDRTHESSTGKGVQIELIATPNNPTAAIQDVPSDFKGHIVYDHAYYWPHLTPITKAVDSDIMIFTFSKITGHAGSRIGWAILKDFDLYQKVSKQVFLTTGGVSHDAQLRATQIMRDVVKSYSGTTSSSGQGIFHFGHEVLHSRWARMQAIFGNSTRFTLQELKPEYCTFFGKISAPSPAYAWIHCNREEDVDCNEVMKTAGIIGRPGSEFGASNRYVRFTMIKRQADFENLATHLLNLMTET